MATSQLNTLLDREHEDLEPQEVIRSALTSYANISISFSGAEDVVMIDMAVRIDPAVKIFSLDTGRLHPETYRFIEQVREHYGVAIEILFPEPGAVEALVREKGFFSFYTDGHKECCGIRKVAPLRRKLSSLDAWITGQRRDQSPGTRAAIPVVQEDLAFSTEETGSTKVSFKCSRLRPVVYN